ncbi:hypothetical protein EDC04DRAFT_2696471 [Pisolithus marmoratus]|nr:hypothetical protein EDC04DRAFT_2696471 [Pisolithus marmoratus]
MLIIERVPINNSTRVLSSSGGVARDTITVVRAREYHEYWQRAGQIPICKAFPPSSREGTTSFSRRWFTMFGGYDPSQVQFLADLHADYCQHLYPPSDHPAPLPPTMETERHAPHFVTPAIIHGLAIFTAIFIASFAQLTLPDPETEYPNPAGILDVIKQMTTDYRKTFSGDETS